MRDDNKYTAPALEKGLDILDVLSAQDHGLTQIEIARTLNRSVSEIFRMLVVLRRRGLVDLDADSDRYYLTTKLFEMANRTPIVARLTVAAEPIMGQLANATDESVHLVVRSDENVLVIGQVDNPGYNVVSIRLGARIPVWRTSSGRVLVANQSPEFVEAFVRTHPHPDGVAPELLLRELATVRAQGYEVLPSYVIKGVTNISAPIIGHDGWAAAALTIPYVDRHFGGISIEACRTQLTDAAAKISRAIGGRVEAHPSQTAPTAP
ncbi:MAG: IclR family transcriptional regulator [Devosia sp.]